MPIDAKDLRGFAMRVCTQEADEVTLRAAASRAYYSAYHALLPFAERLPVSDGGDVFLAHWRLMSTLSFNEVNQQIERARLVHSMALQIETLVQADVAAPVGCARA
jgi:hypothetical protein